MRRCCRVCRDIEMRERRGQMRRREGGGKRAFESQTDEHPPVLGSPEGGRGRQGAGLGTRSAGPAAVPVLARPRPSTVDRRLRQLRPPQRSSAAAPRPGGWAGGWSRGVGRDKAGAAFLQALFPVTLISASSSCPDAPVLRWACGRLRWPIAAQRSSSAGSRAGHLYLDLDRSRVPARAVPLVAASAGDAPGYFTRYVP